MATSTAYVATSSRAMKHTCFMAYTADLYDTPSGHLDPGYEFESEVAATTTANVAHIIGTQSWTVCRDETGQKYEFTLTPEQYLNLSKPNASMPKKAVTQPSGGS
jgi:hypothetical protein